MRTSMDNEHSMGIVVHQERLYRAVAAEQGDVEVLFTSDGLGTRRSSTFRL